MAPDSGGEPDEEIIGDPIYGETVFYQSTSGGKRGRYHVDLHEGPAGMYYNDSLLYHHWGYYTTKNSQCSTQPEAHDVNGDRIVNGLDGELESHCVPNGDYQLDVYRYTWDPSGQSHTSEHLFNRHVILLDTLGAWTHNPASPFYHDVRVAFDLNTDTTTITGDIRAGYAYVPRMNTSLDPSYTSDAHEVNAGDSLWLISTFVASDNGGRAWHNNTAGVLTAFNPNYSNQPLAFGPAVNSLPLFNGPTPMLYVFTSPGGTNTYQVVGRVTEPYHSGLGSDAGRVQTASTIHVTVYAVHACFGYSGSLWAGQPVSFDASCSTGADLLEFSWNFGDNSPSTSWSTSATIQHTYGSAGTYGVLLSARRVARHTDTDDTTRVVTITPGLSAYISGPDVITTSGDYSWDTYASGGTAPYHYRWHYKQGATETDVGTDSPTYSRYVQARTPYFFRLRDSVTDAGAGLAQPFFWVEVMPGGGGAAAVGFLDASGACAALPATLTARQAKLEEIRTSGAWPVPCRRRTP